MKKYEVKMHPNATDSIDEIDPNTPRDAPFYVPNKCKNCDTLLVLLDVHENPSVSPDEIFWDEWWCPKCNDGIIMDWPNDVIEELKKRVNSLQN